MQWKLTVLVAVFALAIAGPAGSQEIDSPRIVKFDATEGGVEVVEFIEFIQANTNANILYDPNSPMIRGRKVVIRGEIELPADQVFAWGQAVLFFHRLVLSPNGPREGNLWALVDLNSPQVVSHPEFVPVEKLADWKDRDGAYIVTTIPARGLPETSRVRNALAQLSTRGVGRVSDIPGSKSLVIGDFAPVVYSLWKMIEKMEMEAKAAVAEGPPPRTVSLDERIARYEQMLASSPTETAAKYFESRINHYRSLIEKPGK